MITREAIRELAQFESEDGCAITFYYQPGVPQDKSHREEAILVKDLVRSALREAEKDGKNTCAREDLQRILNLAEGLHGNTGKAKAIFADAKQNLWREFDLPPWLEETRLIVNRRFHLRPLATVVESRPRVCVCVVDRSKARLFNFENGRASEMADFFQEVPRLTKSDGYSGYDAGHKERRVAHEALHHFRHVADTLLALHDRGALEALVLGCRDEVYAELEGVLHPYLKQKLLGHIKLDPVTITPQEVAERVDSVLEEMSLSRRHGLVREVLGEAHRNANGAVGLRRVLRSLELGEIHTLLIGERFRAMGSECGNCGHVDLKVGNCSVCNHKTHEIEDLTDAIIGRALRKGVELVFIRDDQEFEKAGHIAALLRFRADQNKAMKLAG